MNYPLIKRCFPDLKFTPYAFFECIAASDLERELEKAVRVYSVYTGNDGTHSWNDNKHTLYSANATHSALLIGIESIKKETELDLLRELIEIAKDAPTAEASLSHAVVGLKACKLAERAKALLERGEK